MKLWLRGKPGGLLAFVLIAGLVAGGLGWASAAVLNLEHQRRQQEAEAERSSQLRIALWRLDSLVAPLLAREDSRPFNHYSAVYAPSLALKADGGAWAPGFVLEVSPLLDCHLPEWMLLHFQVDAAVGWASPQVLSRTLAGRLGRHNDQLTLDNVTHERQRLLADLRRDLAAPGLVALTRDHARSATIHDKTLLVSGSIQDVGNYVTANQMLANAPPSPPAAQMPQQAKAEMQAPPQEYQARVGNLFKQRNDVQNPRRYQRSVAFNNSARNGEDWFALKDLKQKVGPSGAPPGEAAPRGQPVPLATAAPATVAGSAEVTVEMSPLVPLWLTTARGQQHLAVLRLVHVEKREVCQGIVLDEARLEEVLAREVADLLPGARLIPVRDEVLSQPERERTMSALPFQLDPGPVAALPEEPGWTPLRVGLTVAWSAAVVALLAVALGGWSLLDLSERRIRFVSAVTHELRTPLTTLRLYLDMLLGGLVRDPGQRDEYLRTLFAEANRLHRLVANVLDFSRLENQRPRPTRARTRVAGLLAAVSQAWQARCQETGKELVCENFLPDEAELWTDGEMVQQVLGNLVDNACKYSRGAEDPRLWLRARAEGRRIVFEVEDRGPGVPARERRAIFRAFRRGRSADVTAGGVGLGLALARRWLRVLGGRLTLRTGAAASGACFRVELPAAPGV
jgi:signal transduction histidine kinase